MFSCCLVNKLCFLLCQFQFFIITEFVLPPKKTRPFTVKHLYLNSALWLYPFKKLKQKNKSNPHNFCLLCGKQGFNKSQPALRRFFVPLYFQHLLFISNVDCKCLGIFGMAVHADCCLPFSVHLSVLKHILFCAHTQNKNMPENA